MSEMNGLRFTVSIVQGSTHGLTGDLRRAVRVAVIEGVSLSHRHFDCISVNRCRGGINQTFDSILYTRLKHVECSSHIDIKRCSWVVLAVQQPHGSKMNDAVYAFHGTFENIGISNVATIWEYLTTRIIERFLEIGDLPTRQVVVDNHLFQIGPQKSRDYLTADEPRPANNKYARSRKIHSTFERSVNSDNSARASILSKLSSLLSA